MANRFSQVSTSSFKPLSLDEIMAIPLAKQAQHDEASLALDEFSKMEANSLEKDKAYVQGQIGAFQQESDAISNQLLDSGVDRNLKNKVKALRNRKNQEFSLQGKTGQASAAYNQFKANEQSIMARKDLTAEQKERGLAKAKNDYLGVAQGGTYQDYVGTSYIDVMNKGREIASQMKPEEIAGALQMTYNPDTGLYSDGTYSYKTLKPEHIQKVVYQALKNDRTVNDYTNELQELGIEQNPDQMLRDAAVNAGYVYSQKGIKTTSNLLPQFAQRSADTSEGMIDPDQPWNSMHLQNLDSAFNYNYDVLPPEQTKNIFNALTGEIRPLDQQPTSEAEIAASEERERTIALYEEMRKSGNMPFKEYNNAMMALNARNPDNQKLAKAAKELRTVIGKIKTDNPNLGNLSDKKVYDLYSEAKKRSVQSFAQVVKPDNPKNTFYELGNNLIGTENKLGEIANKTIKTSTGKVMAFNELFEDPEFSDMSKDELNKAIGRSGRILGFAPGHTDMPGASVIQFQDDDGNTHVLFVEPDDKQRKAFNGVAKMNKAVIEGNSYHHEEPIQGKHEHVITELNADSQRYESAIIRSKVEIPQDELKSLKWERSTNPNYPGALVSEYNGEFVLRYNFDDEVERSKSKVTSYYDTSANATQGLTPSQDNKKQ